MRLLLSFVLVSFQLAFGQLVHPPNNDAFLQEEVAFVYIQIAPADLNLILTDSLYADHEFPATFRYLSSTIDETVTNVGFRLRGNTSRNSAKKSFKVSFNEFVQGRKWKGVEKLNLNGEHNDVSIMRSRMCNQLLKYAGLPAARTSYVRLYINNEYKGLYLNVEHIDEEFIQRRFTNDHTGNLFKCNYGADLKQIGSSPAPYMGTYELKTNTQANNYSGLINFIDILNNTNESQFTCAIQQVFDVELYLRTLAMEILIGHWDGYAGNKNNYYLYQRPSDGKFVFIEYDMDNSLGVDWGIIPFENWSTRNIYTWAKGDKPLYDRLMAVPYFKDRFNFHMNDLLNNVFVPQNLLTELGLTQDLITQAALEDEYKSYDYGYTDSDFLAAINTTIGGHIKQSLQLYIQQRHTTATNQLQNIQNLENPCQLSLDEMIKDVFVPLKAFDLMGNEIELDTTNKAKLLVDKNGNTKIVWNHE
jgi:hypothetical protein